MTRAASGLKDFRMLVRSRCVGTTAAWAELVWPWVSVAWIAQSNNAAGLEADTFKACTISLTDIKCLANQIRADLSLIRSGGPDSSLNSPRYCLVGSLVPKKYIGVLQGQPVPPDRGSGW